MNSAIVFAGLLVGLHPGTNEVKGMFFFGFAHEEKLTIMGINQYGFRKSWRILFPVS